MRSRQDHAAQFTVAAIAFGFVGTLTTPWWYILTLICVALALSDLLA